MIVWVVVGHWGWYVGSTGWSLVEVGCYIKFVGGDRW